MGGEVSFLGASGSESERRAAARDPGPRSKNSSHSDGCQGALVRSARPARAHLAESREARRERRRHPCRRRGRRAAGFRGRSTPWRPSRGRRARLRRRAPGSRAARSRTSLPGESSRTSAAVAPSIDTVMRDAPAAAISSAFASLISVVFVLNQTSTPAAESSRM